MNLGRETYRKVINTALLVVMIVSTPAAHGIEAVDAGITPANDNIPTPANDNAPKWVPLPPQKPKDISGPVSVDALTEDGDADGVLDDTEKELVNQGKLKPEDAEKIPVSSTGKFTVHEDLPLREDKKSGAKVIGTVKKGETFSVITVPGEDVVRTRFSDGRKGFVEKNKIVPEALLPEDDENAVVTPLPPPRPKDLEANCSDCDKKTNRPKAIDSKNLNDLSKVSKHLNQKSGKGPQAGGRALPRTRIPDAADEIAGLKSGKLNRLRVAARKAALQCRVPAGYLKRRYGRRAVCGNRSKGLCYRAVKEALMAAGIVKGYPAGASAKNAHYHGILKRAGMKNIMPSLKGKYGRNLVTLAEQAPAGAVLVYDGGHHGHGHIEIKTAKAEYCSDFCKRYPVNKTVTRRLIAVYVP